LRPDIIASLQILCVINEPAAATIAYGLDKKSKFESWIIVTYPPNNKAEKLRVRQQVRRLLYTTHIGSSPCCLTSVAGLASNPNPMMRPRNRVRGFSLPLTSTASPHMPPVDETENQRKVTGEMAF